jgi:hypothetical protein
VLQGSDLAAQRELGYVAKMMAMPNQQLHKWTRKFYACHRGKQFPKWWVQDRCDKSATQCATAVLVGNIVLWSVAVYVRIDCQHMRTLRDAYLDYISSQTNNYCNVHAKPLVATVNAKGSCTRCTCEDETAECECCCTRQDICAVPKFSIPLLYAEDTHLAFQRKNALWCVK